MYQTPIHIVTAPVWDLATFQRTAFWLSRSRVDLRRVFWSVMVDTEVVDFIEIGKVLGSYRCSYQTIHSPIEDNDVSLARFGISSCECRIFLPSDAILLPEALPGVVASVELHPTHVTVSPGSILKPETLRTLDRYGSGFNPATAHTAPSSQMPDSSVRAYDPARGRLTDPEFDYAAGVYLQLPRPLGAGC